MEAVVSVEHLTKRYGETVAVADVSFEVAAGEIFGLIGPNGERATSKRASRAQTRTRCDLRGRLVGEDPSKPIRVLEFSLLDCDLPVEADRLGGFGE